VVSGPPKHSGNLNSINQKGTRADSAGRHPANSKTGFDCFRTLTVQEHLSYTVAKTAFYYC
jgi:hypothetical protein